LARAVALTENLLKENKNTLAMVSLIPSTGGVFEVKLNDEIIFSKKELNRYPEENEIEEIIKGKK
jgi:selenoprotein W-related protein